MQYNSWTSCKQLPKIRAVNLPFAHYTSSNIENWWGRGMIDDVIMHGTWCLLYKTRDLGTRLIITNLGWHSMRKNNVVGFVTFHLIDLLPNDPIIKLFWKSSSHVSGLSISLWLCGFGCVLQVPIRLKVIWVDAKNQWDFGI